MQFGVYLVRCGAISAANFVDVIEKQWASRPALGALAIETHKISIHQLFAILDAQAFSPKPFGATAVTLGFLSVEEVEGLLRLQGERTKPIYDIVTEMGLLDEHTIWSLRVKFYSEAAGGGETADVATDRIIAN